MVYSFTGYISGSGRYFPNEIEAKIKAGFSSLKKRVAKDFRIYPLEYAKGIQISEVRDSLRNHTKVELMIPHPCVVERTINDAVKKETGRLLLRAITQRFRGVTSKRIYLIPGI